MGHKLVPEYVPAPTTLPDWGKPEFATLVAYLNAHLANSAYVCGEHLSIADFSVAAMMTYYRFADFPFSEFQHINRWYTSIESLDSWRHTDDPL